MPRIRRLHLRDPKGFLGIQPINYTMLEAMFPHIQQQEFDIFTPSKMRIGHMTRDELAFLVSLVKWRAPEKIFEIGTFDGLTTVNMASNMPKSGIIYTLDIDENEQPMHHIDAINRSMIHNPDKQKYLKAFAGPQKIETILCDSAKFDFSPYRESIDIVFVDAAHTYDYCYTDSLNALKIVKKNGLVIWHDYDKVKFLPGVTEALNKIKRENKINMYWMHDPMVDGGKTSCVFHVKY